MRDGWESKWKELFFELFTPSEHLQKLLKERSIEGEYAAVHIRFVNALDPFEEEYGSHLSDREKEDLIKQCLSALRDIRQAEMDRRIIVFSDSVRFLERAKSNGFSTLDLSGIGHISFSKNELIHDKTFIDFFAMAKAEKVYSIRGRNLYNSVFSRYAAVIGNGRYIEKRIDP